MSHDQFAKVRASFSWRRSLTFVNHPGADLGGTEVAKPQELAPNVLSDTELLAAISRDLRAIYSDVIRAPVPEKLAAALDRLEFHSCVSARLNIARAAVPPSASRLGPKSLTLS